MLRKLLPQQVKVVRDGNVIQGSAEQLVPGDIVLLEQGDNVPADCRLVEAFGVRVNNAAVTGEALPKARDARPSEVDELIHGKNIMLAGTSMVSGQARAVVFATGIHTEFGKIAHLTQTAGEVVSPLGKELAHLSRLIAVLAIVIGLLFFAIGRRACDRDGNPARGRRGPRASPRGSVPSGLGVRQAGPWVSAVRCASAASA